MNNRVQFVLTTRRRDSEKSHNCEYFELGIKTKKSTCNTDGHYMCSYCKHNVDQDVKYAKLGIETGMLT